MNTFLEGFRDAMHGRYRASHMHSGENRDSYDLGYSHGESVRALELHNSRALKS